MWGEGFFVDFSYAKYVDTLQQNIKFGKLFWKKIFIEKSPIENFKT